MPRVNSFPKANEPRGSDRNKLPKMLLLTQLMFLVDSGLMEGSFRLRLQLAYLDRTRRVFVSLFLDLRPN